MITNQEHVRPAFYTVREAAQILRVAPSTLYRSIRDGDFPAVRLRGRYVVPVAVLDRLAREAMETGGLVDPANAADERRTAQQIERLVGRSSR